MIGYKAFDKDLKCRGFQFEVGKTYETGVSKDLKLCTNTVFHFCRELNFIEYVSTYTFKDSRFCEVIAEGDVVSDGRKFGTNKLHILREIHEDELLNYINSGNRNSGNRNSGSWNSGDWNSGNKNSGNKNSGNRNSGDWNSGSWNSGDWNSGSWNSGDWNSGFFNSDKPFVRMFNKETKCYGEDVNFPDFLYFDLTVWVSHDTATLEEKKRT